MNKNVNYSVENAYSENIVKQCRVHVDTATEANNGTTPLMVAAAASDSQCVNELVKWEPIDAKNNKGHTALMYAITEHLPVMVQLLIKLGASLTVKGKAGNGRELTPLEYSQYIVGLNDEMTIKEDKEILRILQAAAKGGRRARRKTGKGKGKSKSKGKRRTNKK